MNYSDMNQWDSILNPKPDTRCYVTKDGMYAAVPIINSKQLCVIHNGQQIKVCRNYESAKKFINQQVKNEKSRKKSIR